MNKFEEILKDNSKRKKEKLIILIVIITTIAAAALADAVILNRVYSLKRGEKKYNTITEAAVTEEVHEEIPDMEEIIESKNLETEEEKEEFVNQNPRLLWLSDEDGKTAYFMNVDANQLLEFNEDYIGWIYGCGGKVNYPVCQSSDEQYYLKHGFDKSRNAYGSLFSEELDNGLLYTDAIIYGHHMKNGAMFNHICDYKDKEYFDEHPYFYVFSNRGDAQYAVFSAYYIDMGDLAEKQIEEKGLLREERVQNMKARSLYDTGVEVSETDNIITLVTCEYTTDNGRMIVHCKKMNN